ncbi:hypothetical protein D3C74_463340 [compost metagenome]
MLADRGEHTARVAPSGNHRMPSGQGSLGDVDTHAAAGTGDEPDGTLRAHVISSRVRIGPVGRSRGVMRSSQEHLPVARQTPPIRLMAVPP